MELLFEFNRGGSLKGVKESGILMEHQLVWLYAQKYNVHSVKGTLDVQKILHISPGVHLYLLTYDTQTGCRFELKATMDIVVATLQLRGKSQYSFGSSKNTTDSVSGQYSLFSLTQKELLFTVNAKSSGQSLLIFMPKQYVGDLSPLYKNAKHLVTKRGFSRIFPPFGDNRPFINGRTRSVVGFLLDYLRTENNPDTFIIGLTIKTFVSLLLNYKSSKEKISNYKGYSEEIENIVWMLSTELSEFPGIRVLSRMMHVNTTTFKKMFSLKTGTSPLRFWHKKRMEKAYDMLLSKGLRPSDVADHLGYSSLHAFDKAFKKYFGVAPSEIIQKDR